MTPNGLRVVNLERPTSVTCSDLIDVRGLRVDLVPQRGPSTPIVRGVDITVEGGEILGIVGESGSGKSVLSLALVSLLGPEFRVEADRLRIGGRDVLSLSDRGLNGFRGRTAAMVFQDPASALDPLGSVGALLAEAQRLHSDRRLTRRQVRTRSIEILTKVGFPDPERRLRARPHQLSGGLRQRLMIALALVNDPKVVIADEPTTALDTTIQAQVVELLETQREGRATVLITHDLELAGSICDTVAVMYAGTLVEVGPTSRVLGRPQHPYTDGLLSSAPRFGRTDKPLTSIPGSPPGLHEPRRPCAFEPRCDRASGCDSMPRLEELDGACVACWHPLPSERT